MTSEFLTDYELQRLRNIQQNQEILAALNIDSVKPEVRKSREAAAPKRSTRSGLRRSSSSREALKALPKRQSMRILEKRTGHKVKKRMTKAELKEIEEVRLKAEAKAEEARLRRLRPPSGALSLVIEQGATENFTMLMRSLLKERKPKIKMEESLFDSIAQLHLPDEFHQAKVLRERIYSIAIHPSVEKTVVFTGGKEGALAVWDPSTYTEAQNSKDKSAASGIYVFKPHGSTISNLKVHPVNSEKLYSSGYDGTVRCLNIERGIFSQLYAANDRDHDLVTGFDHDGTGNVLFFSNTRGILFKMDTREAKRAESFVLSEKKIGSVSVCPVDANYFCTASLDNTIRVWDVRMLKPEDSQSLKCWEFKRSVTSVYFHPTIRDSLVSTCYDDHIRIHKNIFGNSATETAIRHNNQTGRWITMFKAIWDPKSTEQSSAILVGNMNKCVDIFNDSGKSIAHVSSEWITAQPAVVAAHRSKLIVASGNATGKLALYKVRSKA